MKQLIFPSTFFFAGAAAMLAGCWSYIPSVGPEYERVELDLPAVDFGDIGYQPDDTNYVDTVALSPEGIGKWWERLGDRRLDDLMEAAVTNSLNYKMALNRHEQAHWTYLSTWSAYCPNPTVQASWYYNELRANNVSLVNSRTASWLYDSYTAGIGGSWQIDIFGGSRRASEAGWALYEAEWETVRGTWLKLTTEVAGAYVSLKTTREVVATLEAELAAERRLYESMKKRGESDKREYALRKLETLIAESEAHLKSERGRAVALANAIAVLLGETPGENRERTASVRQQDSTAAASAASVQRQDSTAAASAASVQRQAGAESCCSTLAVAPVTLAAIPLETMRTRPDVLKADRELAEKIARVGVAKALWYPKLYLVGSVGVQSTKEYSLFMADSLMSSVGPSVEWPIFHFCRIISQTKLYETRVREAAMNYEQTLKRAYGEVRTGYAAYVRDYGRLADAKKAAASSAAAFAIAEKLEAQGDIDFDALLGSLAAKNRLAVEDIRARGRVALSYIDLCKALGGGLCR